MGESLNREFENYPFEKDGLFQEGLRSIEASDDYQKKTIDEKEAIIGRAKAFYFARVTGRQFDWDSYVLGRRNVNISDQATSENTSCASPTSQAITELSLHDITQLIQSGQTHLIPNNFEIPSGVNNSTPSQSAEPIKTKPWEATTNLEDNERSGRV